MHRTMATTMAMMAAAGWLRAGLPAELARKIGRDDALRVYRPE